jgi:putative ABC transport system permease protein
MSRLRQAAARLREIFAGSRLEREFDEELRFHLDMETELNVRRGMSSGAARTAALRTFGGVERVKEENRDRRGVRFIDELRRDVAYALRAAGRSPGFTAVVVLTLMLGIGATTAIFTVVRGVLLRELPFAEPARLVRVWAANPSRDETRGPLALPDFEDWRRQSTVFERMAAFSTLPTGLALVDGGEPIRLRTAYVSADFFTTLGVGARIGRVILPVEHETGRDRVVVLSHALWRARYGGDPAIVGRQLRLNDEPFTVVGVLPPAVRFPAGDTEAWAALSVVPATGIPRVRGVRWLHAIARLRPGASPERARSELGTVARRLEAEFRDSNAGWSGATVVPLREDIVGGVRPRLLVLFGVVVLVLALACVNVANLVLARSAGRAREMAVRVALGAGRGRLARQLLTESVLLALAGGVLGVAVAWWGAAALVALTTQWLPPAGEMRPDWVVLTFALLLSTLTGVAFGLIPATRSLQGISGTLREGGRGSVGAARSHALRRTLVAAEVALAVMLVASAGLFVKSFARLSRVELGFDATRTVFAKMTLPASRYATSESYLPVAQRMLEQVRATPGVASAAAIKDAPFRGPAGELATFTILSRPAERAESEPLAHFFPVTPGYFRTMRIALEYGRDLTTQDGDTAAGAVVVSEAVARRYWPSRSPIGEEIGFAHRRLRVVGVVGDARYTRVDSAAIPAIYIPQPLMTRRIVTIVARTNTSDAGALLPSLRAAIHTIDRDQPITEMGTMRDAVADAVAAPRFLTLLVGLFGVLALLLATVGVYGVVAYVVGQRTNEIGVRMALGARSGDIVAWTLRTGMTPVVVGLALGVAASLSMSRALAAQLYEVSPNDPVVFASVALILATVSLLASGVPAFRAARVDPTVALRG